MITKYIHICTFLVLLCFLFFFFAIAQVSWHYTFSLHLINILVACWVITSILQFQLTRLLILCVLLIFFRNVTADKVLIVEKKLINIVFYIHCGYVHQIFACVYLEILNIHTWKFPLTTNMLFSSTEAFSYATCLSL